MSNTMKFTHAPTGEINVMEGKTSYADIFKIGAMTISSETKYPGGSFYFTQYPTDKAGLEIVSMKSGELLTSLHDAISVIGVLMANADAEEIQDELSSIAWVFTGLSELAEMVSSSRDDMEHTLAVYDQIPPP